jgi:hypothetical protein
MYVRRGMGDASSALIGGAISGGVSLATSAVSIWLNQIQLAHDADTATTQIVNGLAPLLQANVNAYLAGPGTCQDQAAAEAAYLTAVRWLMSSAGCGNGAYGSAGNRCISNRFGPGGPTDDTNPNNVQPFYPWADYYYYPIANDPRTSLCAAQVAADNPNAAEEAAIQNIGALTSGSNQQTTPGMFDVSSSGTGAGTAPATSSSGVLASPSIFSSMLGPFPVWAWLAGVVGLVLVTK